MQWWAADPICSHVLRNAQSTSSAEQNFDNSNNITIKERLKQTASRDEICAIICDAAIGKIASVPLAPVEDVEPQKLLVAYGLDILVSIERRNWMANELDALMTLLELTSSSSLVALTRAIAKYTKLVDRVVLDEED